MKKTLLVVTSISLLSACGGELSYKRGASVRELEHAKKGCASAGNEEAQLSCLRQQGWSISQPNDNELFAEASVSENQPHAKPKPMAQTQDDELTAPAVANSTREATSTEAPVSDSKEKIAPSPSTKKRLAPPNENTVYVISSWWKLGANGEAMKKDMNTCETTLGEAHKPNATNQTYTRAFVVCMFQKGWKGLKANGT